MATFVRMMSSWIGLALGCATPGPTAPETATPPVAPPQPPPPFEAPQLDAGRRVDLAAEVGDRLAGGERFFDLYPNADEAAALCPDVPDREAFLAALAARRAATASTFGACERVPWRSTEVVDATPLADTGHICPGPTSYGSIEALFVADDELRWRVRVTDPVVSDGRPYIFGTVTCEEVPGPDAHLPKLEWHAWARRADTRERVDILAGLHAPPGQLARMTGLVEIEVVIPEGLAIGAIRLEVNAKDQRYRGRVKHWGGRDLIKPGTLRWKVPVGGLMFFELTCDSGECRRSKAFPVWVQPER